MEEEESVDEGKGMQKCGEQRGLRHRRKTKAKHEERRRGKDPALQRISERNDRD